MTYCLSCGDEINENAEICPECGVNQTIPLEGGHEERDEGEKYCVECGELINERAEICPECGVRQPSGTSDTSDSNQVAAGVLALLLGGIGAHKFYQGNTKMGLIYLCLSWTFIPALISLVEGILILVADESEYEEKYADGSIFGR